MEAKIFLCDICKKSVKTQCCDICNCDLCDGCQFRFNIAISSSKCEIDRIHSCRVCANKVNSILENSVYNKDVVLSLPDVKNQVVMALKKVLIARNLQ